VAELEAARERYFAKPHDARTRFERRGDGTPVHLYTGARKLRGAWAHRRRHLAPWTSRALARTLARRR
jgi:hypothetical protein